MFFIFKNVVFSQGLVLVDVSIASNDDDSSEEDDEVDAEIEDDDNEDDNDEDDEMNEGKRITKGFWENVRKISKVQQKFSNICRYRLM